MDIFYSNADIGKVKFSSQQLTVSVVIMTVRRFKSQHQKNQEQSRTKPLTLAGILNSMDFFFLHCSSCLESRNICKDDHKWLYLKTIQIFHPYRQGEQMVQISYELADLIHDVFFLRFQTDCHFESILQNLNNCHLRTETILLIYI